MLRPEEYLFAVCKLSFVPFLLSFLSCIKRICDFTILLKLAAFDAREVIRRLNIP